MILLQVLPEAKYLIKTTLRLLTNKNRQKGGSIKWAKKNCLANLTSKFKKNTAISLQKLS